MAKGKKEPPSKKELEKKVNKIVEDKTFGVSSLSWFSSFTFEIASFQDFDFLFGGKVEAN